MGKGGWGAWVRGARAGPMRALSLAALAQGLSCPAAKQGSPPGCQAGWPSGSGVQGHQVGHGDAALLGHLRLLKGGRGQGAGRREGRWVSLGSGRG